LTNQPVLEKKAQELCRHMMAGEATKAKKNRYHLQL